MVSATQQFITNFSPYDTIGVVRFYYTASVLYAPSTTFGDGTLNTLLGSLSCGNNTNTTSAMWLAYEQLKSVGLPLAYNSIVLFTDGSPNGVSANFPVRTNGDTRYGQDYTQFRLPPPPPINANATAPFPGAICTSTGTTCSMPVVCTGSSTQTITGTIAQEQGQTDTGNTAGLYKPINTDSTPTYPSTCQPASTTVDNRSGNGPWPTILPNDSAIRQFAAYIPDFDIYGNSTHGIPVTAAPGTVCPGSTCTVATVTVKSTSASFLADTRDFWRFQANDACNGATGPPAASWRGDESNRQSAI